ncbi:zf-HC2 domain-containing protein [Streptomyces sp. TG1A-8]|uniref:anti-sigma factor family protein n=1 Tax=Streptomyces sp. TG1A-8 TaxID=3051385 RepID=UPI00265C4295|nr:zf-HC2 domain-containing protein [Streptomyces sp. TG1A-8]MDO0927484.1 zf-HC2 domain-containing protein [Streptomyces sp. TG1A-8]
MSPSQGPVPREHETVGAYALGILDDAEATAFEAHLAGCEWCARQLDELAGMEPMLAALADLPGSGSTPAIGESLSARPAPRLVEKLVDEVAEHRARKRRRGFYTVAAAAALIIAGPLAVAAVNGGPDGGGQVAAAPAQAQFQNTADRRTATDPTTHVTATVALQEKAWGTQGVLRLKNVKGPLKCSLVLVAKDGQRVTMSSWSVPAWGYGVPGARTEQSKKPLYIGGAAAFKPNEIDHFEVVTFDGKKLVQVDA